MKAPPEYSMLTPDTSSLSASPRSKGVRFNSQITLILHKIHQGAEIRIKERPLPPISTNDKQEGITHNPINKNLKPTSKEMIIAKFRIAPIRAHSDVLDQPTKILG